MSRYTVRNIPMRSDAEFHVIKTLTELESYPDHVLIYVSDAIEEQLYVTVAAPDPEVAAVAASIIGDIVVPLDWVTA